MPEENVRESEHQAQPPQARRGIGRREVLKGLASVPVLGLFVYGLLKKRSLDESRRAQILSELGLGEAPAVLPKTTGKKAGELIRLGIIGFGGRGEDLIRAAGFAHPDWVEQKRRDAEKNKLDKWLEDWLKQEDLNIALTAVCDVFDVRAERGLAASKNEVRPGGTGAPLAGAKRYRHYQELLASKDVDAVIIATPDHWHAQMAIDAAQAGKHVYLEKCMTRTEEEVYRLHEAVTRSGIVFQLGHQNRQQATHAKAREIVQKGILGPITLVETTTNRNSPGGAWVYDIHKDGSPQTIDWEQFQGPAPHKVPFSLERFFRWRCWFDYGTGLSGDLLSHEYDAVNQILDLVIPHSAVASGGIYFYKDGRDVPDVFHVVFEYPERNLTLIYSATLASNRNRGKVFMGHDAAMEVGGVLTVTPDYESTRFKKKIEDGVIDPSLPLFTYHPGAKGIDAVTSASEQYFASRGLLYTYREGKRVDVSHLHIKEWLDCIRNGGQPSCNIERGFEEAITCHMATKSYLEGRKVLWDPVKQRIV
ncbi:MAG: Gfo/Idh/MocA family oxidoreductase [bacterium]|jgi:predicted dehydrogenase|nr:Gfo/Idh/MocA family oxidoreductase [candidate division KSB1 bacterium]MDH7560427.1 Gfo/Idh/MocA family oxidoreductase [bacterium]